MDDEQQRDSVQVATLIYRAAESQYLDRDGHRTEDFLSPPCLQQLLTSIDRHALTTLIFDVDSYSSMPVTGRASVARLQGMLDVLSLHVEELRIMYSRGTDLPDILQACCLIKLFSRPF